MIAEIDRGQIIRGKYDLDVVGHYARPDIFQLQVDERPKRPVTTHTSDTTGEEKRVTSQLAAGPLQGQANDLCDYRDLAATARPS